MVYKAKIDTAYYCDINGHYTPDGIARLRSETDRSFEEMAEMRPAVTAGVCVYKGRINEKLQERSREAYNDIVSFIGEPPAMMRSLRVLPARQPYTGSRKAR